MHDLGDYILKLTMVVATAWIVQRFWGGFFEKKKSSILSIASWIAFCIFQALSQWNNFNINIGMTIINALLILSISIFGYEGKVKAKCFLLAAFYTVWSLFEIFTFFLLTSVSLEKERLNIMGMVISKILMIIFVYIVSMVWNKKSGEFVPINFYLFLLLVPAGSIYIAINEFYYRSISLYSMVTISILLLFNVVIFEIYIKMNEIFMYEKEKTVYAQQLNLISLNTVEQKKMMEEFHEEKHNLINELIVLKGGIENDDRETVIRNLDKIINNCNNVETISNSGNSTIDTVINFKYAVAREYGIAFKLRIFIPDELPIEQCDIGVILGNAIDNAIEAVRECNNKEKIIEISMGVKKEAWIMVIKNPYEHEIKKDRNGEIMSTKKENNRHGYGLKSIKKIAEVYHGEAITDIDESTFSLTVVLNFGDF